MKPAFSQKESYSQERLDIIWIKAVGISNDIEAILLDTKEQLQHSKIDDDEIASLLKDVKNKLVDQSKLSTESVKLQVRIGILNGANEKKRSVQVVGNTGDRPADLSLPKFPNIPAGPESKAMNQHLDAVKQMMQKQRAFFPNQALGQPSQSYSIGATFVDSKYPIGVRIEQIHLDGKSKLKRGDIVTKANGFELTEAKILEGLVRIAGRTGQSIELKILRDGQETFVSVMPLAIMNDRDPDHSTQPLFPNLDPRAIGLTQIEKMHREMQMELSNLRERALRNQKEQPSKLQQ